MLAPITTRGLDPILRGVSRSIFLTLRVAPGATRRPLGVAYLFCRAADTIADTRLLSRESRLASLRAFREQLEGRAPAAAQIDAISRSVGPPQSIPEEQRLLARLRECFDALLELEERDQALIRKLVTTLTRGMELDLERFPPEESGQASALESDAELDLYTYYVAGCVGEFWTDLHATHLRALRSWDLDEMRRKGIRFGKGLQMTNILRDVDRDLAIGRAYFPRPRLDAVGASPGALRAGKGRDRLEPILQGLLAPTLAHYREGWEYTLAIPRSLPRMRLACAWPLLIGLKTLAALARARSPYAPGAHVKIDRSDVYSVLGSSTCRIFSNRELDRYYLELERSVGVPGAD